ncbi:alkene reductase [Bacillus sp. Xin]|uniref:alkene reductase n=1 Tax=unclassified Bacillus (in: firmicutes) TaxID=185979 RepID=UPI00157286C6|nr:MULTISPECIES: alkene reductase [unclassified Bacillus (in: firmicutes)]MBC6975911.1 alkene reductase [Bacillus sp. Xin]NSW38910.1 alkene reductase [Bacillus sp. Xin1]
MTNSKRKTASIYEGTNINNWGSFQNVEETKLFDPIQIGTWSLRNRVAMAPMTRCFADDKTGVVGGDVAEYYRKRAADGVGLIITEGIVISPRAKGNPGVPGLYTRDQIESWKPVTEAVHNEGGTIIAQIWHVGRMSHHELTGGFSPQAPSAIAAQGNVPRYRKPFDTPEAMTIEEIQETVEQYAQAARNAIEAGFDGVEIHGAHGYLIDQFTYEFANHRKDQYGGDLKQRLTFMKEVLQAVISAIGADKTLIRFSAFKGDNPSYMWEDPEAAIQTFVEMFHEVGLTMIHPSTMNYTQVIADGKNLHQLVRKYWNGIIVGVGNLNPKEAEEALQEGAIDVVAFGRPLIANPDFVHRVKLGESLEEYDAKQHLATLV